MQYIIIIILNLHNNLVIMHPIGYIILVVGVWWFGHPLPPIDKLATVLGLLSSNADPKASLQPEEFTMWCCEKPPSLTHFAGARWQQHQVSLLICLQETRGQREGGSLGGEGRAGERESKRVATCHMPCFHHYLFIFVIPNKHASESETTGEERVERKTRGSGEEDRCSHPYEGRGQYRDILLGYWTVHKRGEGVKAADKGESIFIPVLSSSCSHQPKNKQDLCQNAVSITIQHGPCGWSMNSARTKWRDFFSKAL